MSLSESARALLNLHCTLTYSYLGISQFKTHNSFPSPRQTNVIHEFPIVLWVVVHALLSREREWEEEKREGL